MPPNVEYSRYTNVMAKMGFLNAISQRLRGSLLLSEAQGVHLEVVFIPMCMQRFILF